GRAVVEVQTSGCGLQRIGGPRKSAVAILRRLVDPLAAANRNVEPGTRRGALGSKKRDNAGPEADGRRGERGFRKKRSTRGSGDAHGTTIVPILDENGLSHAGDSCSRARRDPLGSRYRSGTAIAPAGVACGSRTHLGPGSARG